ncbi:ABI gene family member 3 [Oenanthe melanoleuca]|uniref:ABI gene family member 3 n=1 Tax=Oenanthe melanoleuca TaxID=2939378 RepID=UPI0024C10228|nr:ABI gene family member 3 [Oenanthe melanoleuca]
MSELERLRLSAIPEGRRLLREQHGNLRRVAEYCQDNYLQASDKRKALEETMALSTQSLASVAYQVGSVAGAFLRLLELQAAQLRRVEADVTCVAQRVAIHKEKVSRREIGALAVPRRVPSGPKVAAPPEPPELEPPGPEPPRPEPPGLEPPGPEPPGPEPPGPEPPEPEPPRPEPPGPEPPGLEPPRPEPPGPEPPEPQRYRRKPLDLSALDGVGHGVKDTSTQLSRTGTLARRSTKGSSAQPGGTLGRSSRVPEPVQPPVVPQGKLPLGPLSSSSAAAAPGDGIPVPPPPPGPPLLALSPPGPPLLAPSPPGPPPPAAAIPPPPPLPAHLAAPPAPLPPPAVPEFGDLTLPPPPAVPEFGDLTPPPPAVLEFGDLTLPPPAEPEFGDLTLPPPLAVPEFGDLTLPPPLAVPEFGDLTPPPPAVPPPPAADDPPWAPQNYLEKVVARYPYARQKDTELSLAPGALLFVTRRFPDGWCEGVMDSGTGPRSGIFPGNFVEPV